MKLRTLILILMMHQMTKLIEAIFLYYPAVPGYKRIKNLKMKFSFVELSCRIQLDGTKLREIFLLILLVFLS
jgi:hypothetical protein